MSKPTPIWRNVLGLISLVVLFGLADYGLRIDELVNAGTLSNPSDRTFIRIAASAMLVMLPTARILAGRPRAGWARHLNILTLVVAVGGLTTLAIPALRSAYLEPALVALRGCFVAHLTLAITTPVPIRLRHRTWVWAGSLAGATAYMAFAFYASYTRSQRYLFTLPLFALAGLVSYPLYREFVGALLADIERVRVDRRRAARQEADHPRPPPNPPMALP
ncbi:MAG TPA: hypothetical protein ENJ00_02730 [Phycisphaerales bacterium]|nr:hypothetical protein [Phycisphaerales bacterium]